jgi:hypothetical protein
VPVKVANLVGFLEITGPPQFLLYRSFRCAMCLFLHDGLVSYHGKGLAIMRGGIGSRDFFDRGYAAHCIIECAVQCWKLRAVVLGECVDFMSPVLVPIASKRRMEDAVEEDAKNQEPKALKTAWAGNSKMGKLSAQEGGRKANI